MRLVTYESGGRTGVGAMREGAIVATGFADMLELIRGGSTALAQAAESARRGVPLERPRLLAPLARPGKLLFCGINYASHRDENPGAALPTVPFFFSKLPTAVIGPGERIVVPSPETRLDYEVELAVVIARRSRSLDRGNALGAVFGYTVVNDVSARDVQFTDAQITLGKGFDTFCPMGPTIALTDEIRDPSTLRLAANVNGEPRQSDDTSRMLFDVPRLLEFLSRHITLEPGDIVSTGTPAGVGHFRTPPAYLQPGDTVTVEVSGIGQLTNPVVAGW